MWAEFGFSKNSRCFKPGSLASPAFEAVTLLLDYGRTHVLLPNFGDVGCALLKRQRAGAVQDLAEFPAAPSIAKRLGLR